VNYSFSLCFSTSHTTNILVMSRLPMNRSKTTSECTMCSFFFYLFYTDVYGVARMFIAYLDCGRKLSQLACCKCEENREFCPHWRCSLCRDLFTAKINRGDRDMRSNRRCSLMEVLLYKTSNFNTKQYRIDHITRAFFVSNFNFKVNKRIVVISIKWLYYVRERKRKG
jgi:hypothetical protein